MNLLVSLYLGFVGLFIGSFLNVLIDRLPKGKNVLTDRSRCDHCHRVLSWSELIPLFSYVLQKGRCRHCRTKLSLQYPVSEIAVSLLFLFVSFVTLPNIFLTGIALIIGSCLFVIAVIDIQEYIIPDVLVLILSLVSFLYLLFVSPHLLPYHLLSAVGAVLFIGSIWFVTKGKGMGFGDVKFAGFMGLSLGFPQIVVALYGAFLTGAVWGIIMIIVTKKKLKSRLPFGPFLIIGYVIGLVGSSYILKALFGLNL